METLSLNGFFMPPQICFTPKRMPFMRNGTNGQADVFSKRKPFRIHNDNDNKNNNLETLVRTSCASLLPF